MNLQSFQTHRTGVTEAIKGRLSKSIPSTHKKRLENKSHLTGELAAAAFEICECFHFWHLVKLAEANQVKDFPAARRLAPAYAQCSVPSFNSKQNSGVNSKEKSNFRTLCLSQRVSQRGKERLGQRHWWQPFPGAAPTTCGADTTRNSLICTFPILTFN